MRALVWTDAMIDLAIGVEFLQRMPDPVLIVRDDETICFANPAAEALVCRASPMAERPIGDLIRNWKSLGLRPTDQRLKARIDCGDGDPIPVELSTTRWRRDGSHFRAVVIRRLFGDEATNDRQTALALAQTAQKRLEQVVEMLPQAVCMFDAQDRYVLWNRRYAELYPEIAAHLRVGISFAEILRLSLKGGDAPEKIEDNERWLAERLAKHARPSSREEQEWRDGRWILHDDRRLGDGGAIGMRIDITDIKRREASFRLLFQSNPVPMLLFEPETLRIIDVNDAAMSVYGFPRDMFLARSLPDLHEATERSLVADTFSALRDMYDGRTVWRHRTAHNDPLDVLIFVRASQYNERLCFLMAIVDVSDRVARRFLSVFEAPFRIANAEVQIGASLGFAIAPQDGASLDELLAAADVALYAAKAAGRNTWRAAEAVAPPGGKHVGAPPYRLRLRAS